VQWTQTVVIYLTSGWEAASVSIQGGWSQL